MEKRTRKGDRKREQEKEFERININFYKLFVKGYA